MSQLTDSSKQNAAKAALQFLDNLPDDVIIGIGTGSTTNAFIHLLKDYRGKIGGAVATSSGTKAELQKVGIPCVELNSVTELPIYIDGADEVDPHFNLIKGGGGALTQEKLVAHVAKKFICIVDEKKVVDCLGSFPLPIEVLPMARSLVARELVKLGGTPKYREHFTTDNGNIILDVSGLKIAEPLKLEQAINQIPGVICNGIFALNRAHVLVIGNADSADIKTR
ncbi:MAG: ribose-5-phosphate isomerase RpiA [Pseudomonadota bacterium]